MTSAYPRVYAHRGMSTLAPENTMAAFAKCLDYGVRWFEFDVDIMGDGTLLVIHDNRLDRTTSGRGSYYTKGFSDLRRLDAGSWFSPAFALEPVPELASVIDLLNGADLGANLEIKPCRGGFRLREELVHRVAKSLESLHEGRGLLVSSFDHQQLRMFHHLAPDVPLGYLVDLRLSPHRWRTEARELGCAAIHPGAQGLTRGAVGQMRDAGFDVNVWTVNDPQRARELASWGVTGVFTDRAQDFPSQALRA